MARLVVDVGEQQRPHDGDADRRGGEPGGRDPGRTAQRLGRDAGRGQRRADEHRPARTRSAPIIGPPPRRARVARLSPTTYALDAREHPEPEVAA